jgi:hypothetical protein
MNQGGNGSFFIEKNELIRLEVQEEGTQRKNVCTSRQWRSPSDH